MHVLGGKGLHETAERQVGHGKARRLAADEQAWNAKLVEPNRDRKTGCAVREMEIEQDQVGIVLLGRGNGPVGIGSGGHNPVARIVLDQIFDRRR